MKVCPDCQSRFTRGETFCPNDGTKLVDARELSPGKLTGLSLDDLVSLEELELADDLGERYRGKLEENGSNVRVTAFNQAFKPDPDRDEELQEAMAGHPGPMPEQALALHSYRLEGDSPFLVEEYPRGPSLRSILDARKTLDWKTAVRITANIARTVGYLCEKGIHHSCLHPGSIFITDVKTGAVQIGEWAHGILSHRDSPLEYAEEHPEGFLGYAGYMAPESVRHGDDVDQRSLVYVAGMLLYEMIVGKAPFTSQKPEDTLKRHLHEKPLKLAIAKSGADLHPELDDVLDMMWVKNPERRFQSPGAIIGALASLVDYSPNDMAAPVFPRDERVFDELPTEDEGHEQESDDEEESADTSQDSSETATDDAATDDAATDDAATDDAATENEDSGAADKKTMMGLPSVATQEDEDGDEATEDESEEPQETLQPPESGPRQSIIIEDPELRSAMEEDEDEGNKEEDAPDTEEAEDEAEEESDKEEPDDEAPVEPAEGDTAAEVDSPARETMLMAGGQAKGSDVEEDEEQAAKGHTAEDESDGKESDEQADADEGADDEEADVDQPQKETLLMGGADAGWDSLDEEFDSEPSDQETSEETADQEQDTRAEDTGDTDASDGDKDADREGDDHTTEDTDQDDAEEDEASDHASGMAAGGIGSVEVEDDGEDVSDDWFGTSTEEHWETQQVQAVEEKGENVIRYATIGVAALLVLGAVGFYLFVESSSTEDDTADANGDESEVTASDDSGGDTDEVDLDRLKGRFDNALAGDRILQPRKNSAIQYLEDLKRHGADSSQYEDAREAFVEAARAKAKKVEGEQLYAARNLAGSAAQFSDDDELQAYADSLDEQWRNAKEGTSADAGSTDADTEAKLAEESTGREADPGTDDAPPEREDETEEKEETVTASSTRDEAPSPTPSANSVSDLLSQARSAASSGNNAKAKRLYRNVLDKSSSNSTALSALGQLYFDDAAYSQAAKYYERVVRARSENLTYRLRLGMTYYKLGQFSRARDTWQGVIDRDPGNARAKQYIKLVERKLN